MNHVILVKQQVKRRLYAGEMAVAILEMLKKDLGFKDYWTSLSIQDRSETISEIGDIIDNYLGRII